MGAPEVETVAGIVEPPLLEGIMPGWAQVEDGGHAICLVDAEDHIERPGTQLPESGVPPTVLEIRTRGPLAGEQRLRSPVGDIAETNRRVTV